MNTYIGKDNRVRYYNEKTQKVTSYPRFLMEQYLGRKLEKFEQIHHKDEDALNNDLSNLEILIFKEHQKLHAKKLYFDKEEICKGCGNTFIWSAKSQSMFHRNSKRRKQNGPFCSKKCSGKYGGVAELV